MPTNDSIERVTPSVDALPPVYSYKGMLKVVYSNRPDLVRQRPWRIFRSNEEPVWFPENTITGESLETELLSLRQAGEIVVTNSLYLLRAFQMSRLKMGKAISFVYIHFEPEPHSIHVCPFSVSMANDLELLPVPQLDWEILQSEEYLAKTPA